MTNVKIISGSNGSGKSLYLSKLYNENEAKSLIVSDFTIFHNISSTDLINREMSKGQHKLHMLLKAASAVSDGGTLIIDDIDTYLNPDSQQNIISHLIEKNPNIKNIIVSTHSPMIIMKSWQNCVINLDDISGYEEFLKEVFNV